VGTRPDAVAITPNGQTAYVADTSGGTIIPVNLATDAVGPSIPVGANPSAIAITPDGQTAYVVYGSGSVVPVNLATDTVGASIGVGSDPTAVAITPNGQTAYVTSYSGTVTPIDIASNTAGSPIVFNPINAGPDAVAIAPNGQTAYVTTYNTDTVIPIDIATNAQGAAIGVGSGPDAIAVTPDSQTAYVANSGDSTLTPIDLATNAAETVIPVTANSDPNGIAITPDQAPTASFTDVPGTAGSATTFDASASSAPVGTITSYAWSFGDGSTATTSSPTIVHTFDSPGSFTGPDIHRPDSQQQRGTVGPAVPNRLDTGRPDEGRLQAGGCRRWHLHLRRRRFLRLPRELAPQPTHRGHGHHARREWVLAGRRRRRGVLLWRRHVPRLGARSRGPRFRHRGHGRRHRHRRLLAGRLGRWGVCLRCAI
jgi:YVTN family beta-propeller protein